MKMCSESRITGAVFLMLGCVLFTAGEEVVKRLQELEGNTVTLHTGLTGVQSNAQILWFYGPEKSDIKIVESLFFRGEINTDYNSSRFRDRLQLDRSSGSLTIRNISREDSGPYRLQIITGTSSNWRFSVKVYAPVSKPVINQPGNCTENQTESCSPVCSVENGENVSLSWYEDKERISTISTADSSNSSLHLHLPLNRTFPNCYIYTCVSDNPVSNQTTQLNIAQLCKNDNGGLRGQNGYAVAVILLIVVVVVVALCALWKRKRNMSVSEDKMIYADINTQTPKEAQKSKQEDNGDSVVYSSIRT